MKMIKAAIYRAAGRLVAANEQFYTKEPALYLVTAFVLCGLLSLLSPTTLGIVDYLSLVVICVGLYNACLYVDHLKAADAIFYLQIPMIAVISMAMIDGFGDKPIGFWFENFKFLTTTLSLLELLALIIWTPWANVANGLYRAFNHLRFATSNGNMAGNSDKNSSAKDQGVVCKKAG